MKRFRQPVASWGLGLPNPKFWTFKFWNWSEFGIEKRKTVADLNGGRWVRRFRQPVASWGLGLPNPVPNRRPIQKKSQRCARFGVDVGVHRSGLQSARASETVMMTSAQPEGYRKIAIMRWRFLPAIIKKTYQKDEWRRRWWNRERRGTQRNDNNQINSVRLKETWLTPSTSPSSSWPRWFDPAGRYDRADRKLIPQL